MKKQIIRISAILLTAAAVALNMTCKEENPELSISPSPQSIVFDADGKNAKMYGDIPIPQYFEVITNQKSWEASSNQGWLKVIEDIASNSFSLEASENTGILPSAAARVTVSAGKAEPITFVVQQKANTPSLTVIPEYRNVLFSIDGETATSNGTTFDPVFTVTTNVGSWKAESDKTWLTVEENMENNTFTLTVKQNTKTSAPEEAKVTVKAGNSQLVEIFVNQEFHAPSLTVMPEYRNVIFSIDGETATSNGTAFDPIFTVTTNVGSWKAESDKIWLTVEENMEDNTFTLTAKQNPRPSAPEEAKVTVTAGNAQLVEIFVNQNFDPDATSNYRSIINPYADVDFNSTMRLRSQFHMHTTASDGSLPASTMLSEYAKRGYEVIAITDHDCCKGNPQVDDFLPDYKTQNVNYKTEYLTIEGKTILKIQGVEITHYEKDVESKVNDHFNNFFIGDEFWDLPRTLIGMKAAVASMIDGTDAIVVMNHPWRCQRADPVEYYSYYYTTFPKERLVGIEIGNNVEATAYHQPQNKTSTQIWDDLLTRFSPERSIYGFATDDAHILTINSTNFFGLRWVEIIVPENTIPNVKDAMRDGHSFCFIKNNNENAVTEYSLPHPSVQNVTVNEADMSITVECTGDNKIEWISCGKVISGATGKKTLLLNDFDLDKYVRFEITGTNWTLYSQPFMLEK